MSEPANPNGMGNDPPDRGDGQRRWLEQLTLQWEADGNRLLRPMASLDAPRPVDR